MRSNKNHGIKSAREYENTRILVKNRLVPSYSRALLVLGTALLLVAVPLGAQQYTFEEVASGLKHQDPATRLRAIEILKDADYADAAVPIAALLEDKDDRVQLAAIEAERALFTSRA